MTATKAASAPAPSIANKSLVALSFQRRIETATPPFVTASNSGKGNDQCRLIWMLQRLK
nr:hypothetical protein Iba_chr04aCG12300 [Ipomoea batatas]GMC88976.1 hypothetical protein Iba_chr04eCG15130 [Ipomoea batatas]